MAKTPKKITQFGEKINGKKFASILVGEKAITLEGVGVFELKVKNPYMGYIPTKKAHVKISGDARVYFTPEAGLKAAIKNAVQKRTTTKKPSTKVAARKASR